MNAQQKTVVVDIFNDLYKRAANVQDFADRKPFGDQAAVEDAARAKGLRTALQYMAEFVYEKHHFDLDREAAKARGEKE